MIKLEKIDGDVATIAFDDITMNVDRSAIPENAQEGAELNFTVISQEEPVGEAFEEITETKEDNSVEETE
jgi:hypothetical protein